MGKGGSVCRLERRLVATIKTVGKDDAGVRARSKFDGPNGLYSITGLNSTAGSTRGGAGTAAGGRAAGDAKGGVEGIGRGLTLEGADSGCGPLAGSDGVGARLARALQLSADEACDDPNIKCRAVVEAALVCRFKGRLVAAIESIGKHNARIGAGPKVKRRSLLGTPGSGITPRTLRVALGSATGELTRVGSIGALVVLNITGALEGGGKVQEGCAVDGKGAIRSAGRHWRRRPTQGTGEGLEVVVAGGGAARCNGSD